MDCAASLVYFLTAHSTEDFHEIDAMSMDVYSANMREIIEEFFSVARTASGRLEDRRKELENLISTFGGKNT